jgi:bifunctional DNA-binding transcriptional regulator/antitoxin component of YhaV-PrlF toxin-antitoxin module
MKKLEIVVTVQAKNEITIPQPIAERNGIELGQRLIIVDDGIDGEFTIRMIRTSYAGALAGVFGDIDENLAYARGESDAWE